MAQLSRRHVRLVAIVVLCLCAGWVTLLLFVVGSRHAPAPHAHGPRQFTVRGTMIIDPYGHAFIPHGANYAGPNYLWPRPTAAAAAVSARAWNFNMIRVNVCLYSPCQSAVTFPNDSLDAIVSAYTHRGIVVMPELHDWTCRFPDARQLDAAARWWWRLAERYRANPYVWFNPFNEPGYTPGFVDPRWIQIHQRIIATIRDKAQAGNIIVVDGTQCGQDAGTFNAQPVPHQSSAILSAGGQVKAFHGKIYPNIVFDVHIYDQWAYGDARLRDYLTRVHAAGDAIMIGETGNLASQPWHVDSQGRPTTTDAVYSAFRVAPALGVGLLAWHFNSGDGFSLVKDGDGYGCSINNWQRPTNLTWLGHLLWAYSHTFQPVERVDRSAPALGCRDPVPPPDLLYGTGKMYAHSALLTFDSSSPAYFGDDAMRLVRTAMTPEWAVWTLPGMTRLQATTWFWPGRPVSNFSFYASADDSHYTPLRPAIGHDLFPACADSATCWTKVVYDLTPPPGTAYIKIVFPSATAYPWTPQLAEIDDW